MITIRPGSHIHRLLQLVSTAGEIPTSALALLGNERVLTALVRKLESVQDIRFHKGGPVYRVKLIQVSGKKGARTIRLYKKGLPVLDGLYPGLYERYMATFNGHCFSGNPHHIGRNHRVAEALAACMAADVEMRPYALPTLQRSCISLVVTDSPSFYIARDFKKADNEANKTMYSRIVGALFYPGGVYAAYNTRDAVMKWSGLGEVKTQGHLLELARMNAGLNDVHAALLFGQNPDVPYSLSRSGLMTTGLVSLIIAGAFIFIKLHSKFGKSEIDSRNFKRAQEGTYGTAAWMSDNR